MYASFLCVLQVYGATKAAVEVYNRGWARDFAPRGITANVVAPGPTATTMGAEQPITVTQRAQNLHEEGPCVVWPFRQRHAF